MIRKNDSNYLARVEKWLKSSMKKKITITSGTIVAFMITGAFMAMPEMAYGRTVVIEKGRVGSYEDFIKDRWIGYRGAQGVFLNPGDDYKDGSKIPKNNSLGIVAIGYGAEVADGGDQSTVIGHNAKVHAGGQNGKPEEARQATVIGAESESFGAQAVVVGYHSQADRQSVAVGSDVYARETSAVAIGSDDNPRYTQRVTKHDFENYFQKLYQKVDPSTDINENKYGYDATTGQLLYPLKAQFSPTAANGVGAIAIGSRALAYSHGATAMGTLAFALGQGSTALGTLSRAEGEGSIALGNKTKIFASNSVGTGNEIQVLDQGGMGYGYKAFSGGKGSIAIGRDVYANTQMIVKDTNAQDAYVLEKLYEIKPKMTDEEKKGITEQNERITAENEARKKNFEEIQQNAGKAQDYITQNLQIAAIAAQENKSLKEAVEQLEGENKLNITAEQKAKLLKETDNYLTALDGFVGTGLGAQLGVKNDVYDVIKSNDKHNAIVIGTSSVGLGSNSIALGKGAFSLADNSFAIGSYSYTDKDAQNAISLGLSSKALSKNAMAFGVGAAVAGSSDKSISIGSASVVSGENSAIFGTNSFVQGKDSILVGTKTNVYGDSNLSFGNEVNIQQSTDNLSLGNRTKIAQGVKSSVVLGNNASIGDKDLQTSTNIENATAIGYGAKVVEGSGKKETGINSMALGKGAVATLENSVALGVESATDYTFEQLQKTPWASKGAISIPTSGNTGVISVGSRGQERRIVNVASGALDTDAVNVAQLKTLEERFDTQMDGLNEGGGIQYLSVEKRKGEAGKAKANIDKITNYNKYVKLEKELMYIKARQEIADEKFNEKTVEELQKKVDDILKGDSAIPRGDDNPFKDVIADIASAKTKTGEEKSKAFTKIMQEIGRIADGLEADGYPQKNIAKDIEAAKKNNYLNQGAEGIDSIALGYAAATSGAEEGEAGKHAVAIGFGAKGNAASSIALGDNATTGAGSLNSIAIGKDAKINDNMNDSIAIGSGANVAEKNSIALGSGAKATGKNSIALGNGAETGTVSKVTSVMIDKIKYGDFVGDPTTNGESRVLSLGKPGEERTITNVAAGRVLADSTDAINGSQLYATNKVLSNLANTSKNVLGDSFDVSENGEISVKNGGIGGTGKTTVSEAISSIGDKTITLSDGTNKITKDLKNSPEFVIKGDSDINVVANGQMSLSLNKGKVEAGETKVVSGDAVSKAIAAAKPVVEGKDEIVVEKSDLDGADKFTVSLNKENLINKLGDSYVTKADYKVGKDIDADKWKEKLGVSDLALHYKADKESDKTTTLAKGLTFKGDDNIKVATEDNGVVIHTLNKDLKGINSIAAGNGQTISFETDGINVHDAKITNMGHGIIEAGSKDAVTGGDIYEYTKGMAKADSVLSLDKAIFKYKGDTGTSGTYTLGSSNDFALTSVETERKNIGNKNLRVDKSDDGLTIKYAKDPKFTRIDADEIYIGDPGAFNVSITKNIPDGQKDVDADGNKIPGMIYAGGHKIANIAPGEVEEGSKAAVNGDQLWRVDRKVIAATDKATAAQKQADENKVNIQKNKDEIIAQGNRITTNERDIAKNKVDIKKNQDNIATNKANIATNAGNIKANKDLIDKGWTIKVTDTSGVKDGVIHLGNALEVEGEKNVVTTLDSSGSGNKLHISMVDTPQFGSIIINDNGKITGVKGGEKGKEVVVYEQLKPALDALNLNITGGTVESPNGKYLGKNTVSEALSDLDTKSQSPITFRDGNGSTANDTPVKLGEDITFKGNNNIIVNLDKNSRTYTINVASTPQFGSIKINDDGKITGVKPGQLDGEVLTYEQYKELKKNIADVGGSTTSAVIALSTNSPMAYTVTQNGEERIVVKTDNGFKGLDSEGKPKEDVDSLLDTLKISALNKEGKVISDPIKLSHIAKGIIDGNSTDAINGSQLKPVIDALGMKVDNKNKVSKRSFTLGNGKTYNNIPEVFEKGAKGEYGTTAYVTADGTPVVYAKDKDADNYHFYKVTDVDENLEATVANSGAVASGDVKIRLQKPDTPGISNVVLTNLADGIADNDAVNVGQLKKSGLDMSGEKPVVTYSDKNKQQINLEGGTNGTKITNLADGADPKDAVNFGQLNKVKNDITTRIDSSETNIKEIKDNTWKLAVKDDPSISVIKQGKTVKFTSDDNLEITKSGMDDFTVNLKLKDNIKVGGITIDGSTTGKYITGLTNTKWDGPIVSGRAATEDQLKKVESDAEANIKKVEDNIKNNKDQLDYAVKYDDTSKNTVSLKGNSGTKITNLTPGDIALGSKDAVNGSQLYDVHRALMGEKGADNPLHFSVTLNDNNNFKAIEINNVKDAIERLKGGWRVTGGEAHMTTKEVNGKQVPELHIDSISGATNIVQGQTLVFAGDGKNLSTHSGSRKVTDLKYEDPVTHEKVNFEGKIGVVELKMSDTPTFDNITVEHPDGQPTSVVTTQQMDDKIASLDGVVVKYDDVNKNKITLRGKNGKTTISKLAAGVNPDDAVNVEQASKLIGDIKYDASENKWVKNDGSKITFVAPNGESAAKNVLDAINLNTKIINKGIGFAGDEGKETQQLGSTLAVKSGDVETGFVGKNLKTKYVKSDNNDGIINVGLSDNPEFSSVVLAKDVSNKVTLKPGANSLSLEGNTSNDKVVLNGLKAGETPDSAVTKGELNALENKIGSLDGSVGGKVQQLEDGMSGTMVYTNSDGDRLVKVSNNYYKKTDVDTKTQGLTEINGKYYEATAIEDGHVKPGQEGTGKTLDTLMTGADKQTDIIISAVKPQSSADTKTPMSVGNIASGLGLTDNYSMADTSSIKDAQVKGLLSKTKDTELNRVSTVRDLQAIAKAGLSFKGNDKDVIERPLGSQLGIEGRKDGQYITEGPNANNVAYSDVNMITHSDGEVIRIEMLKSPKFEALSLGEIKLTPGTDKLTLSGNNGDIVLNGLKPGQDKSSAVTKGEIDEFKSQLGLNGSNGTGTTGSTGPAGKDGLDGKSILDKVQGIRDGFAGTMVYTDKDGNRLVKEGNEYYKKSDFDGYTKANNGNYYNKVKNGEPENGATKLDIGNLHKVAKDTIRISAVNPNTINPTDKRMLLDNIKSALNIESNPSAVSNDKANKVVKSLLTQTTNLDIAATARDLQALAQAGINIKGNDTDKVSPIPLSGTYNIVGSDIDYKTGFGGNDHLYSAENLITHTDGSDTLRIEMLKSPKFETLNLAIGTTKTVTLTPDSGELKLSNTSTPGDSKVVLSGLKGGETEDTAVTKGQLDKLKEDIGLTSDGTSGDKGASGKDGLNGKTINEKIQGLRDGFAGTVVYTDKDGNRLVRDIDNNYYKREDVEATGPDGQPKYKKANDGRYYMAASVNKDGSTIGNPIKADLQHVDPVKLSTVNKDGSTTESIALTNVQSGLGLTEPITDAKALAEMSSLKSKSGADLNNVATIMDLQAVAKAGMVFKGNEGSPEGIHKGLGETLSIHGKPLEPYNPNDFAGDNILTRETDGTIRIEMLKSPSFRDIVINGKDGKDGTNGKSAIITVDNNGNLVVKDGVNGRDGLKGLDGVNGRDGLTKIITERDMNSGTSGVMVYTDKDGNRLVKDGNNYYSQKSIDDAGLKKVDGKYYKQDQFDTHGVLKDDAAATNLSTLPEVKYGDILISAVNPDGKDGNTTIPTTIGNVSGLLDNSIEEYITNATIEAAEKKIKDIEAAITEKENAIKDAEQKVAAAQNEYDDAASEDKDAKYNALNDAKAALNALNEAKESLIADKKSSQDDIVAEKKNVHNKIDTEKSGRKPVKTVTEKLVKNEYDADTAATIGDLRIVAVAGLDFAGNDGEVIHRNLGTKLNIQGGADYITQAIANERNKGVADPASQVKVNTTEFSGENIATHKDGEVLRIEMLKSPLFKDLVINGANGKDGKDGKSAIVTVDKDGNLVVKNGTDGRDGLNGLDGTSGTNGRDGKNGFTKIVTEKDLNAGTSGTMVYTDKDGNRVVEIAGKYYGKDEIADKTKDLVKVGEKYYAKSSIDPATGKVKEGQSEVDITTGLTGIEKTDVQISTVNPDGTTTTATVIRNVASSLKPTSSTGDSVKDAQGVVKTLTGSTDGLSNAATVGDLKTLALSGLDFAGNDGAVIHRNLGTKLNIEGIATVKYDDSNKDKYSAENLITHKDGEVLRIEMLKKPNFEGLVVNNGKDGTDGTPGKSAVITVDDKGNVIVKNGIDGKDGIDGRPGKDGFSKIVTEKDLNTGLTNLDHPLVYLDSEGNELVKADDGNYYKKTEFKDLVKGTDGKYYAKGSSGEATGAAKNVGTSGITISAVNPDGANPIVIGNVASLLKPTSSTSDPVKDAQGVVETLTGSTEGLNNAATVGDLKTIALAGLDFAGNDGAVIHRNLGTKLNIEGIATVKYDNSNKDKYSAENLITHKDGEVLRIEMLKKPKFEGLVMSNGKDGTDGKSAVITVDDNGNLIAKNGIDGTNGVDGKDGFTKIITEKDLQGGTSGSNGADGLDGKSIVDKVNSLRDGLSGPMVYTDAAGNRIVKGNDGHFYAKGDIDSDGNPTGTALNEKDIHISAVNPDGSTQVATTLGNTKGIIREAMKEFTDTDVATAQKAVSDAKDALTAAKDALTAAKNNFMSDANDANRTAYLDAMNEVSDATKALKAKEEALALAKPKAVKDAEDAITTAQTALTDAEKAVADAKDTLNKAQTEYDEDSGDANKKNRLKDAIDKLAVKEAARKDALNKLNVAKADLDKAKENAIANDKVLLAQKAVKDKLLKAEGKDINTVATVGDLQAVALAGLDFEGNTGEAIHKNLGEKLNIEGMQNAEYREDKYSTENLVTYNDEGTLRVAMLKNPKFDTVTLTDGTKKVTLGVDGKDGIGIKGEDGKVDKFVTETKLDDKLQGTGFKVKVTDGDGNSQDLDVKLGDTVEFKNTDKNIVLKGTPGTGTSTSGGTTTGGTSGGTAGGSTGGSTTGGTSGTSGTSEHTVDINLAKDLEVDNIKVTNKVEAKEVEADKVTTKEIVTEKLTTDKFETNELKVGTVVIKNGEITGVKTAELDESGHVAKEDEGKLVNGGTLNKTIDNLRAENAQFREGVQGAIQQNSQRISKLETKVNKGLANAAAMAGINFMEIGVNQATVGAAVGGYEGTQAVAVGVQAAPTQDFRINAKVSLTPGSHSSSMYSVGASWRFDLK